MAEPQKWQSHLKKWKPTQYYFAKTDIADSKSSAELTDSNNAINLFNFKHLNLQLTHTQFKRTDFYRFFFPGWFLKLHLGAFESPKKPKILIYFNFSEVEFLKRGLFFGHRGGF